LGAQGVLAAASLGRSFVIGTKSTQLFPLIKIEILLRNLILRCLSRFALGGHKTLDKWSLWCRFWLLLKEWAPAGRLANLLLWLAVLGGHLLVLLWS